MRSLQSPLSILRRLYQPKLPIKQTQRSFVNVPRRDVTKCSSNLASESIKFDPGLEKGSHVDILHKGVDRSPMIAQGQDVRVSFSGGIETFNFRALRFDQVFREVSDFNIDSSTLTNGVDLTFLNQVVDAYRKLSNNPKQLEHIVHRISKESHKPLAAVNVEVGEFLYGLADTFNITLEAVKMGISFESKYLPAKGEKSSSFVTGNHPSNFTVYIHPIIEAMALGIPAILLNHPNLPTSANYIVNFLEGEGVDFTGRLVHGTVGSEADMQAIYEAADQGIFIGDKPSGERLRRRNPKTYLELSGTNPYVMTHDYFAQNSEKAIEELKFNLTYSDGKQCTAPSVLVCVGFTDQQKDELRERLQIFSNQLERVPAPHIDEFGQHRVSFPIAGNPGNVRQFEDKVPFIKGTLPIFQLNDIKDANEVFGLASGFVEFDSLGSLELTRHQLSLGASLSNEEVPSFLNYLKSIGPKRYAGIVNLGDKASNLAACPTGERFFPFNSTQSGWDVGMGDKSPLRFKSGKITDTYYELNQDQIDSTVNFSPEFNRLLNQNSISHTIFKAEAFAILQDLKPTLNSRPQGPDEVKLAFELNLVTDDPLYVRLTSNDTNEIKNNYIRYILHSILLGNKVAISYSNGVDLSMLTNFIAYDAINQQLITLNDEDDDAFIKRLGNKPVNVLCSNMELNKRIVDEVNPQFNLVPNNFSPWYMADIIGSHKSFKMNVPIDKIRYYGELLHQTFNDKLDNCRSMYRYALQFHENSSNDFETQITETIKYAQKHNLQDETIRDFSSISK